jgi:1,4-alpha-glucan branching enzyme
MAVEVHNAAIESLMKATHGAPFQILGAHNEGGVTVIRALRPGAQSVTVIRGGERTPMQRVHADGLYEAKVNGEAGNYQFEIQYPNGQTATIHDPYRFGSNLTDFDVFLLGQGRHYQSYEKLGAHLVDMDGVSGVNFTVWAPNARRVSVVGNFNNWDVRIHPMRKHESIGMWELFIPGLEQGEIYKYDVLSTVNDYQIQKSDPYAFYAEKRPRTASRVWKLDNYTWHDDAWMTARAAKNPLNEPMSTYEVHLGSWKRHEDGTWLTYRELADQLVPYVRDLGYTHIELMPVAEHPFDGSWGYQVTGYFAPTSRYGTPEDFMHFVDTCHQNNIGVIVDWVPAHFPKDGHALSYFDGTHLYEHSDSRKGEHPDWGTYIFNYGRNEVANFLVSNALFWLKIYHIDGLRVDAVASMLYLDYSRKQGEWIPNQYGGNENLEAITFLKTANELIGKECPGAVTIAEESTAFAMVSRPTYIGGLGFTFKWNMGWMHDSIHYMQTDPIYRKYHHNQITFSMLYFMSENFVLSLSHDEVVHGKGSLLGKMPGDQWQQLASLRLLFGYQYTHPGKKLNFMGAEFGQWLEWNEGSQLDWVLLNYETHKGIHHWTRDLNNFYKSQPALYQQDYSWKGFRWIEPGDAEQSVYTYARFAEDPNDCLIVALNFTPVPRLNYRIGVPLPGFYAELVNSDSEFYGGGNVGNGGGVMAEPTPNHGFDHSIGVTIPPLGMVVLKPQV